MLAILEQKFSMMAGLLLPRDKSLSAQFEHTIGVTETGVEIFTESTRHMHLPPYTS